MSGSAASNRQRDHKPDEEQQQAPAACAGEAAIITIAAFRAARLRPTDTERRPVVDAVVGGFLRVGDPSPALRGLQPEVVAQHAPGRRASADALLQRRDAKAEL